MLKNLLFVFFVSSCFVFCVLKENTSKKDIYASEEEEQDRMDLAIQQEIAMTKDPALGYVPKERLIEAYETQQLALSRNRTTAALDGSWHELGPTNVSGRTRAILIDANDATGKTVFAGSVGGGLWKTTDITASTPLWTPVNDMMGNLSITSIAQDPSNPNNLYFTTGEGFGNADAIRGLGIWKSTNGGTTWAQISATNNATYYYCQKIVVNSTGVILAATYGGLMRSANGGTSWTKVLGTGLGITGAASNFAYDVEIAANGDIYASISGSIHKSTNAGVTFGAAMTLPVAAGRIDLACAPNDANYVYAMLESGSVINGIIRTTDGGANWISRTEPADADTGIPSTDFSRGQAWYDLSMAVDPNNKDVLMVGAVDLFKSTDGAATWTQISHWYGGFSKQYVHADQHIMIYKAGSSNVAYFGNDGGIYQTQNASASVPTISFKGNNYNVTQFYACAIHPTSTTSYYLAGAQDNGSQKFTSNTLQQTVSASGGDGAFCHIDQDEPQYQFTSYVYNNYYRSTDGGGSWTNITHSSSLGRFINPSDYDDANNNLYAARSSNQYVRWDNAAASSTFSIITASSFGGQVSAIKVSPNTAHRVFFGIDNGTVFKVDNANTASPTFTSISTGLPSGYPACIEVQTGNDNHLLVTYTNYGVNSVWESTNGGTSWTSVEGNLPDMPIRWALFNPSNASQVMLATELGIWTTDNLNGTSTAWGPTNTNFANVRVDMLQLRQSDKVVIAATHGRGLFWSDIFTSPTSLFSSDKRLTYMGKSVQFFDNSYKATSWLWNFGDGTTSTLQNPSHVYPLEGSYTVSLKINSNTSMLEINDFVKVLGNRATPYTLANGGDFESNPNHFSPYTVSGTAWERGSSATSGKSGTASPSNAWVTGLSGSYLNNTTAYLYTPSYNLLATGAYTLSFASKFSTESGYDGFRVEYSLNGGETWIPLGTTTGTGWYNFANTAGDASFPVNEAFFSGNASSAFNTYSKDISFLAGNTSVEFRFDFRSDFTVAAAGVAIDNFSISGATNPAFPVALTAFSAEYESNTVMLHWNTENEIQLSHYDIERSEDLVNFTKVGKVEAKSNVYNSYTYKDYIKGIQKNKYYYRLKMVDIDNTSVYSNVINVYFEPEEEVNLFPNPFKNWVNMNTNKPVQMIEVYNTEGKLVYKSNQVEDNKIQLDASLPKGTYIFNVLIADKYYRRMMVKN